MSYEEKSRISPRPHNISLEDRKRLSLSGVEDVESFDESQISMKTSGGRLIISGEGLNIGKLDLNSGEVTVSGLVTELCYEDASPSGSLWSRLFH